MNPLANMWYWKRFYWKLFTTLVKTGGGALMTGLSGTDWASMSTTQHLIFCTGIAVVVVTAWDALFDQTFNNLSSNQNGHQPNGNGNGVASAETAPAVQKQTHP